MDTNCGYISKEMPFDKLKEECGVFGIYSNEEQDYDIAQLMYYGLFSLQHRGQESCGIVVNDVKDNGTVRYHKDIGLVSEVFSPKILQKLTGSISLGHVRYSTTGGSNSENAQPLIMRYIKGTLAVAHNGNLINTTDLRNKLEKTGITFHTTIDSEVIACCIARERVNTQSIEQAVQNVMKLIKGSYSLLIMSPKKLIAARDPLGMRPLVIGKLDNSYVFASETCALDSIGAEFIRDVEPGEVVIADENGLECIKPENKQIVKICLFEYIYFARPDSTIEGANVYEARREMGVKLAKAYPVDADLVVGVPDSGLAAAAGYAQESGIKLGEGLIKNRYMGRTFIKPDQKQREQGVMIKLNAIKHLVEGKKIILVDDSIVRGTTSKRIVQLLKKAGAKEIHMRISSPPVTYSCYFGIDTPKRENLIASYKTIEEIEKYTGADSLRYLSLKDTMNSPKVNCDFCSSCFTGKYLFDVSNFENADKFKLEWGGKIESV